MHSEKGDRKKWNKLKAEERLKKMETRAKKADITQPRKGVPGGLHISSYESLFAPSARMRSEGTRIIHYTSASHFSNEQSRF